MGGVVVASRVLGPLGFWRIFRAMRVKPTEELPLTENVYRAHHENGADGVHLATRVRPPGGWSQSASLRVNMFSCALRRSIGEAAHHHSHWWYRLDLYCKRPTCGDRGGATITHLSAITQFLSESLRCNRDGHRTVLAHICYVGSFGGTQLG